MAGALTGCSPDAVAPGYYAAADDAATSDEEPVAVEGGVLPPVDAGGVGVGDGAVADLTTAPVAPVAPCDLTGRWLVTRREVATAIGAVEAAHTWYYYELTQTGSQVTVAKGLHCGEDVRGVSSVAANVDYPKTWPAMMANEKDDGRAGTSMEASGSCAVSFAKHYDVAGATVSFYTDPSQSLPTLAQRAMGSTPGWEDWDGDGQPGYTMNVTGLVTGQIYIVTRSWSQWSGTAAEHASTFTLPVDWDTEQDVLGINGPSLLSQATTGVKDNDASQHFATFARLGDTQATGDDATVCNSIRSLAPTLTPSASN
jgi:hypothetical protein